MTLNSPLATADGTHKRASLPRVTKLFPIRSSSAGGGAFFQSEGKDVTSIRCAVKLSGISMETTIRFFGGSSESMWTKYSTIASEKYWAA